MKGSFKRIVSVLIVIIIIFCYSFADIGRLNHKYFLNLEAKAINENKSAGKDIVLSGEYPEGKYILKYANESGAIEEYEPICIFDVDGSGKDLVYDRLINVNSAPVDATIIGIYNEDNEKVGEIDLAELQVQNLGEKKYSFAVFSDVHIGTATSEEDFKKALQYVEGNSDINFTTICGDFIHTITKTEQLETYKTIVDNYTTKPVYAIAGNHEAGLNTLGMEELKPYTGQDLYYSFDFGNDVFIMVGDSGCANGNLFANGQLQWLYETLEANKEKRCFVFQHVRPDEGCGNPWGIYKSDIWGGREAAAFESLLRHYPNVTFFHGHSHMELGLQNRDNLANYDNNFGCHSVHIPSLTRPRTGDERGPESVARLTDESEGYVVDVYENGIMLKGRDFISDKFMPIATYLLDTTIKAVESNSYIDLTGLIINDNSSVLKEGDKWYNSKIDKSKITEISFVEEYEGVPDETWNPAIAENNQVTAYREGTKLFIKGNKYGITANTNCKEMFAGFTNLKSINGFENLNKSYVTNIEGMFKDCSSLSCLDLSSFSGVQPVNMANVFSGCKSLIKVDLSDLDLSLVKQYLNIFYNCSALQEVVFSKNVSKIVYMSGSFNGCTSIQFVDLSVFENSIYLGETFKNCRSLKEVVFPDSFTVTALNSCFVNCISLEALDISSFNISDITEMISVFAGCSKLKKLVFPDVWDTNKVKSMVHLFYNCPLLEVDCSTWDITSSTDIKGFKTGSPGVVLPNHRFESIITEPTCTNKGYTTYRCCACGYSYVDSYIKEKGHVWGEWNISSPTCDKDGVRSKVCSTCGTTINETIPAYGHNYATEWTVDNEATCTQTGSKSRHCNHCDAKTDITTISAKGHTYGDWKTDEEATVNSAGSKHKACIECGEIIETAKIAQLKCSKPKLSKVINTADGIKVSWSQVSGADRYRVYRKTSKGDWEYIGYTTKTNYTDKTVKTGTKYYYAVRARNEAGNSSRSEALSRYYLADPTLKTPTTTKKGVGLRWTEIKGAEGYVIYRKTASGKYQKLKTEKGVSNVTYRDTSAQKGKKYTYKVKAYYSKTYSAYSNTKTITDKY